MRGRAGRAGHHRARRGARERERSWRGAGRRSRRDQARADRRGTRSRAVAGHRAHQAGRRRNRVRRQASRISGERSAAGRGQARPAAHPQCGSGRLVRSGVARNYGACCRVGRAGAMTGPVAPSHAPATKAARHAQISWILAAAGAPVHSQDELADRLAEVGVRVTQATLSRDLDELGAVRLRGADGALVYALPPEQQDAGPGPGVVSADVASLLGGLSGSAVTALGKVAADLLLSAQASGNLVVLKTPPGAAQLLASMIDRAGVKDVLGTVAGDAAVVAVARVPLGGHDLAAALLRLAEPLAPGHRTRRGI